MIDVKNEPIVVWGLHPVEEFLRHCPQAVSEIFAIPSFGRKKVQKKLLSLATNKGVKIRQQANLTLVGVLPGAVHQGVAARVKPVWYDTMDAVLEENGSGQGLFIACDQVTDPQNLGAIIRSCAAFGVKAVILPERSSAKITGTVVKASAGTIIHVKVCLVKNLADNLADMRRKGISVAGLAAEGKAQLWNHDLSLPLVLVAGAEGKGLRFLIKKRCDVLLRIPCIPHVESLNVSAAVSVALYEVIRQNIAGSQVAG